MSEKIQGTNARIGYVEGELLAGSHGLQRKRPEPEAMASSSYWFPATLEPVRSLLDELKQQGHTVAIPYGEIYGSRVQSLHYGRRVILKYISDDYLLNDKLTAADSTDL